ncbi:MAG: aminotransferase class I/II-fold pyridoxal phosphate-dependent enzyme [Pseudomonadota bacterium]|nr:aminotransferase class I/II-fold pyridoxal phosphate-dependent enzyme [Pseudomonadota bacterium]
MTPLELHSLLQDGHPGALRLLSPLGRRAAMPLGIPQQSEQARGALRKATIGQITDGGGRPLALPSLVRHFSGFPDTSSLLYAPQYGLPAIRQAWRRHLALPAGTPASVPVVASGITHGLSLCADMFTGPDVPVILGTPYWDNYDQIFTMRTGAPLVSYPFFGRDGRFNVEGLAARLDGTTGPALVLLNFPSNPTGYSPYPDEVAEIVRVLAAHPHPVCIVCDDAYNGLYFDPALYGKSLYAALATAVDPSRALVCKVDGATKELVFFGGRIGFLTFSADGAAGQALAEKAAAILRGTVSSVSTPSQAAVLGALSSETLAAEHASVVGILAERYVALRDSLAQSGLVALPFNSGCFALLPLPEGQDAEAMRQRLLKEQSVGVIAVPSANALRIAFCSIEAADIPDLVSRIVTGLRA